MKTTKLIVGILQIIIAAFIVFQSAAVGIGHAMEDSSDAGGSVGMVVALLYLVSGIVYLATKKSKSMTADTICMIINVLAWIFAINNAHDYTDLAIWGWLAFIIGVGFFFWHLFTRKSSNSDSNN